MAKIEFNKDALAEMANRAVAIRAGEVQAVLDNAARDGNGQSIEGIKALLVARWKQEFDRDLTDPHLTAWAEQLSKGGRVEVQQKDITSADINI